MKRELEGILDEIVAGINLHETIVFCGAGISRNSGIPVVWPLLEYLLNKIEIEKQDSSKILGSNLPFEKLMEIVVENCNAERLFDIYDADKPQIDFVEPNTNHIFLAKLAKLKKLQCIITTNFDQLLEKALQNEGLAEGIDFVVVSREENFNRAHKHANKITLIKIHGCIRDRTNMVITLKKVAQKDLSAEREKVIKMAFSEQDAQDAFGLIKRLIAHLASSKTSHKNVLILGYSSSDVFDLSPQIERIKDRFKHVYYIEHINQDEKPRIETLSEKSDKNPFTKFTTGKRIYINTDSFIEHMWEKTITNAKYQLIKKNIPWELNVDDWFKSNPFFTKYLLIFRILYEISELKRSAVYAEKALALAKKNNDTPNQVIWLANLGNVYIGLAEYHIALELQEQALQLAEELGDKKNAGLFLSNIAIIYNRLGDNKTSKDYSRKADESSKEHFSVINKKRESANNGAIYYRLGEYDKAINYFQEDIDQAVNKGDKKREGMGLGNLGSVYWRLENNIEATRCFTEALAIAVSIGDKSSECKWIGNLGNMYVNKGQYEKGIENFKKALSIAEKIGDNYTKLLWLGNLGDAYNALKDTGNAKYYCEQALELSRQLGDKDCELNNLAGLGNVNLDLKEYTRAIEYYEKAITVAVEINSNHLHGRLLACIGNVYTEIDDAVFFNSEDNLDLDNDYSEYHQKATEYYTKALDILVPILGKNHPEVIDIMSYS
ncbi:MAG: tetratricopeptide repeat protein [Proteobacteria bacterium]|nr:tetratricopeptide repeat protein [Pseudomonadota bacterium]